ncbi:hypothetical protein KDA_69190 [Dictyobacter alpinus]|uniref:Uncharacterized protein n=1 Tax=Dictyobacter alpinus TaxID=2014873 RepID=A0A402BJB2_9CHLR|nr:hypothetical protein [Dictyobacter alpinus]GCE31435.1 hypothetical protein KDA_69190 [Dictyobacter alpinus]
MSLSMTMVGLKYHYVRCISHKDRVPLIPTTIIDQSILLIGLIQW